MSVDTQSFLIDDVTLHCHAFRRGWNAASRDHHVTQAWRIARRVQHRAGLKSSTRRMLSEPQWQHKLGLASIPSYGLTLHHHRMRTSTGVVVNSCPSAGDCTRVCVLDNNFGKTGTVKLGWRWRTELLVTAPAAFFVILGRELRRATEQHDGAPILFRPNINSDIEWHLVLPALTSGDVCGDLVTSYGYTKHDAILNEPSSWIDDRYRVAYSWNENSNLDHARSFADRGGAIAVVTNRRYVSARKAPVDPDWPTRTGMFPGHRAVDADKSDEWMLDDTATIGDLAFKPRTIELRDWGRDTNFVTDVYPTTLRLI